MADASETPKERIERLVAEGRITAEAVERARQVWAEQRLLDGITLPTGERVFVTEGDLHHILEDDRILRKPERIERILTHVMELRSAKQSRRMGLSRWDEDGELLYAYVIFESDGSTRTMHVIDERGLRRKARQGERIWPR